LFQAESDDVDMGGAISSRYRYMPQGGHGSDVPLLRHYGKYINRVERNVKKDINRVESNCKKNIICVERNVKNDAACFTNDIPCVKKNVKRTTRVSNNAIGHLKSAAQKLFQAIATAAVIRSWSADDRPCQSNQSSHQLLWAFSLSLLKVFRNTLN
jgi:hypothetical protein